MKVAWIAKHDLTALGGAEMADRAFIEHAPQFGVQAEHFTELPPDDFLRQFDRVVVTRGDRMSEPDGNRLAAHAPVAVVHTPGWIDAPHQRTLFEASRLLFAVSPEQLRHEERWLDFSNGAVTTTWFDTSQLYPESKQDFALWPHRDAWHKDLSAGHAWAEQQGVELVIMQDRPQSEVFAVMRRARWVVMFTNPRFPEVGSRSVKEGYIAGCEPVMGELVWALSFNYSREEMREAVRRAPEDFWRQVKEA